ncbi:AraC family transcriptional regulator [Alkalitalea saponilacus]|uniref:Helix-turn-helix domain-containing protein n=1 Tax=Alkalitalea saponilacus TaxID=889453 RepID=A0A1T5AGK6_9BACT|nr:helix-turn-helix domain-containing protein [Alkalitalea saponilacus]ASB48716.1 hypothetical protein CDL62_05950 [Alkalitalea saponilacus]SKB33887.1 Helix-turn-helix domain-containing protein [Alkalitalea saponilacus]
MYYEYLPDKRLSHLIEVYWISENFGMSPIVQRILPDGCVDIILSLGSTSRDSHTNSRHFYIVGTITSYLDVAFQSGKIQMLGIRFRPAGITAFTRMPIDDLTNKFIELTLADTLFEKDFHERLSDLPTIEECITKIEHFLISRLPYAFTPEKRIESAIDYIRKANGQISVTKIADIACLSERQLERKFKAVVGISPNKFSRIIKFKHALNHLRHCPQESLYSAAIDCGYFDHSHLIKDFKKFGGTVPCELK